jgi:hypothetical protein
MNLILISKINIYKQNYLKINHIKQQEVDITQTKHKILLILTLQDFKAVKPQILQEIMRKKFHKDNL